MSDDEVACAFVDEPQNVIALNASSFEKFEKKIKAGGTIIVNSSLVKSLPSRDDITYKFAPMTEIARSVGNEKMANIVSLGVFIKILPFVEKESIINEMKTILTGKKAPLLDGNIKALNEGYNAIN